MILFFFEKYILIFKQIRIERENKLNYKKVIITGLNTIFEKEKENETEKDCK